MTSQAPPEITEFQCPSVMGTCISRVGFT